MTFGLAVRDATGALVWDSRTAPTGVVGDVRLVPANQSAVFTYPAFAGRVTHALNLFTDGDVGITVDTALGYPRVTVPSYPGERKVLVLVT